MKAITIPRWSIILLLMFLNPDSIFSQPSVTEVSGTILSNTTWNYDTVKVTGTIMVADDVTLTIAAGTYVKFMGYYEIRVQGSLKAEGSTGDTIVFTVNDPGGWKDIYSTAGAWGGIEFHDTSGSMADNDSSILSHCKFSYSKTIYNLNRFSGATISCEDFGKVRISNCYFTKGICYSEAGAVYMRYSDILLKDNYFTRNFAARGGSVYSIFSAPRIINNTFYRDSAWQSGGSIFTSTGTPYIHSNIFEENFCENNGGGLYVGSGDSATVTGNHFFNNYADRHAGAVHLQTQKVLFRNNEIYENDSRYSSGGLMISGCAGSLVDSNNIYSNEGSGIYIENGDKTLYIRHNEIHENTYSGIFSFSGDAVFEYNEIHDNYNNSQQGGGLISWGDFPVIQYNRIYNNSSGVAGGGISVHGNKPVVRNNIITGNSAPDGGGALIRSECRFVQNIVVNNQAGRGGAIMIAENSNPLIINNTISKNRATSSEEGGAFLIESYTYPGIYNNIIYDNPAGSGSNQFRFLGINPDFEINNNDIEGGFAAFIQPAGSQWIGTYEDNIDLPPVLESPSSTAGTSGDGLSADWRLALGSPCVNLGMTQELMDYIPDKDYYGNERIRYSLVDLGVNEYHDSVLVFCGTIAADTVWAADTVKICGDVTVQSGVTLRVLPGVVVEFQDFYRMVVNGTLQAVGTKNDTILFTARDTTNWYSWMQEAGWNGIHISAGPLEDTSRLVYCRLELTDRITWGGVLNVSSTTKLIVSDCLFYHNDSYGGSAITLDNSPILIRNSSFKRNNTLRYGTVSGGAGAIEMSSSNAVIDNCVFINGRSYRGVLHVSYGAPVIRNCTFSGNESGEFCGAIWLNTKTGARIHDNVFTDNDGRDRGGAMYLTGNPVVYNNYISNNRASKGGAIYAYNLSEGAIFHNNLMVNNYASSGGGVYMDNRDTKERIILSNNTIANNSTNGNGGGLYCVFIDLDIYNTIIWGNRNGSQSRQVHYHEIEGDRLNIEYCIIEDGLDSISGSPPNLYSNIFDTLPYFTNPTDTAGPGYYSEMSDWAPLSLSPMVNSGKPDTDTIYTGQHDILGSERIHYNRIDIGAIENQGDIPVFLIQASGQIKCEGESASLEVEANDSVFYRWTKDGIEIPVAEKPALVFDSLLLNDQGSYQCMISNSYGTVASNPALLQVREKPSIIQEPESLWVKENSVATIETFAQGTDLKYQWLKDGIELPGAKTPKLNIDNASLGDEGLYKCRVHNACSSIETEEADLFLAPQICMVTVSTTTGHNLVVWEKKSIAPIFAYNIYRESVAAGIYDNLATIPYDDLSVFVDTTADPTVQAYLYKITAVLDTSLNETDIDLCKPHKTVHLIVSTNPELNTTQLQWDRYYGFDYQTYTIYRSNTGVNFDPVHSLSASNNSWTDPDPSDGDLFYRIAVEKPDPCEPEGSGKKAGTGPYRHSLSNMDNNKLKAGESPPDTIILNNNSINEESSPGTYIGRFFTDDPDSVDAHTYHLINGIGDDDNYSFTLAGDLLLAAEVFDYETRNSYSIRIRTTDIAGNYIEQVFTILILDVDETTGLPVYRNGSVKAFPNPFSLETTITFPNPEGEEYSMQITDLSGHAVMIKNNIRSSKFIISASDLEKGYYLIELTGKRTYRGRIIVH